VYHLLAIKPIIVNSVIEYELPIHLRYQEPSDIPYSPVRIPFPLIISQCKQNTTIISPNSIDDLFTTMPNGLNEHKVGVFVITIVSIIGGILLIFLEVMKKLNI